MKRIDSGFQETFFLGAPHDGPPPMVRSNTAPTHHRKTTKSTIDSGSSVYPTKMESQRPESEKRSRPSHHRSKTSSSETSTTRSRGRGHDSKRSSRRTSCTIVDPTRSRHYRMQSSNTVPTANSQDIDDVYALHHRSYNMFQNPSLHSKSGLPSPTLSQSEDSRFPTATLGFSVDESNTIDEHILERQSGETIAAFEQPTTTMHWTSPCTRSREYKRIDRANTGVRGFLNKVMPRCVSGPPPEKFYEKDKSDAGSVRRYRMDHEDDATEEKELARLQSRTTERQVTKNKKKWICF
jgi:hypothetical protein